MKRPDLQLSLQFARHLPSQVAQAHKADLTRHWVQRCLRHALARPAELTVRIVDTEEARQLNAQYRQKDYATNVLTFDYASHPVVVADLVLCAPVIQTEAKTQGKSLKDHYAHLLVHGCLHAQGWDHEASTDQAQAMEAREIEILQTLNVANPYL